MTVTTTDKANLKSSTSTLRIIVIDDNPAIQQDFIKILSNQSHEEMDKLGQELFNTKDAAIDYPTFSIDLASQGQEGVKLIQDAYESGDPYALAVVDIRMPPGWDGIETISRIWAIDKNIQIVICSAYSDYTWEKIVKRLGISDNMLILKKPFDNSEVRQLVLALTRKWTLSRQNRTYIIDLEKQIVDKTLSLQKLVSMMKSTFESTKDGIIIFDNDGIILEYNNKLITLLDVPRLFYTQNRDDFLLYIQEQITDSTHFINSMEKIKNNPTQIMLDVLNLTTGKKLEFYTQPHMLGNEIIGRIMAFRVIS